MINSIFAAFAMYSRIPAPQADWGEGKTDYAIGVLPLIGIVIGILYFAVFYIFNYFNIGVIFRTSAMLCVPFGVTGGIHMDGFMDTSDALASWQSREKKLEILKDSVCGAFAVMKCVMYFVMFFAAITEVNSENIIAVSSVFVLSRAMAAIAAVSIKNARGSGMLADFTKKVKKTQVIILSVLFFIIGILPVFYNDFICGTLLCLVCCVLYLWYFKKCSKNFGGITGDTEGYFICVSELILTVAMVLYFAVLGR